MLLLIVCLVTVNIVSSFRTLLPRISETEYIEEACPPCELLFSKLERTGTEEKLSQYVKVQERGEPKSGTGIASFWATAALIRACEYLQDQFGEETHGLAELRQVLGLKVRAQALLTDGKELINIFGSDVLHLL